MNHCARPTSMRVQDGVFHLGLRSGDHDIAVRAPMGPSDVHALRHAHAAQRMRVDTTGTGSLLEMLRGVADAAGGAVTAVVVDLTGDTPAFRLRVGSLARCHELPLATCDVVLLLASDELPVEVVVPAPPQDWDAALAHLVAEDA